jgi:hypothetical protein
MHRLPVVHGAGIQEGIPCLAAACQLHGLPDLASRLEPLLLATPASMGTMLEGLALQLARSFLPAAAPWLLRHCLGVLRLPGAAPLHAATLALLAALLQVPGVELGDEGAALIASSELLAPVAAMTQARGTAWIGGWVK